MSRNDHSKSTAESDLIKNTQNTNRFSSVTRKFSSRNLVFRICEIGLYSRDIGVTSRYFGQDSEYIVAAYIRILVVRTRHTRILYDATMHARHYDVYDRARRTDAGVVHSEGQPAPCAWAVGYIIDAV
eukprot:COSAG02_NODE_27_length_51735_cov_86.076749_24_plen_128_part_00